MDLGKSQYVFCLTFHTSNTLLDTFFPWEILGYIGCLQGHLKVKEIPKQNQYWLRKRWGKQSTLDLVQTFCGAWGNRRGKIFFFVITHQKFYSCPQPYPPIIWCVGGFLFCLFLDDEVEKIVFILQTLHASLEHHYISVLCGPHGKVGIREDGCSFLQFNCTFNCWNLILCRAAQIVLALEVMLIKASTVGQHGPKCSMLNFTVQEKRDKESKLWNVYHLSINLLERKVKFLSL